MIISLNYVTNTTLNLSAYPSEILFAYIKFNGRIQRVSVLCLRSKPQQKICIACGFLVPSPWQVGHPLFWLAKNLKLVHNLQWRLAE